MTRNHTQSSYLAVLCESPDLFLVIIYSSPSTEIDIYHPSIISISATPETETCAQDEPQELDIITSKVEGH